MEHDDSKGMLHLHNFNEDFTFLLNEKDSECAGVHQVRHTILSEKYRSLLATFLSVLSFSTPPSFPPPPSFVFWSLKRLLLQRTDDPLCYLIIISLIDGTPLLLSNHLSRLLPP
jgi:hypothetical protein